MWSAEAADSRLRGAVSLEPCWYEVTGLTEAERKAVHTAIGTDTTSRLPQLCCGAGGNRVARDLVSWCAEDWAEVSLLCEVVAVAGVSPLEEGALGKPSVCVCGNSAQRPSHKKGHHSGHQQTHNRTQPLECDTHAQCTAPARVARVTSHGRAAVSHSCGSR